MLILTERLSDLIAALGRDQLQNLLDTARARIDAALSGPATPAALPTIHQLRGTVGSLGLLGLAEALARVELAIASGDARHSVSLARRVRNRSWAALPARIAAAAHEPGRTKL